LVSTIYRYGQQSTAFNYYVFFHKLLVLFWKGMLNKYKKSKNS